MHPALLVYCEQSVQYRHPLLLASITVVVERGGTGWLLARTRTGFIAKPRSAYTESLEFAYARETSEWLNEPKQPHSSGRVVVAIQEVGFKDLRCIHFTSPRRLLHLLVEQHPLQQRRLHHIRRYIFPYPIEYGE